jgi:two-component system phosphate regulon response regulator PhoB
MTKDNMILVVEDETAIKDMIRFALTPNGFKIMEAGNVSEAKQKMASHMPDLIILDWMLPGVNGIDFAKQLKQNSTTQHIPIIMLTAKAEEENKIKGLEVGADDYITKPFSPRELVARIKTILRRGPLITLKGIIEVHQLKLDTNTHELSINQQIIILTPIEYKIFYFFITHQGYTYSREQLLDLIWGSDKYIDERTVDVQIRRLRSKLKPHGYAQYIKTIHGTGYQFLGEKS